MALFDPIALVIPDIVRSRGDGACRYTLDGVDYGFRWRYNQRGARWFLDVTDTDDTPIVEGVPVVCGWPLFDLLTDPRRPPGELIVEDRENAYATPGQEDLGVSAVVYYYPTTEAV